MNYINPDDIKDYVSQHPEGIAGMSEELAAMVNHFAELIVRECCDIFVELRTRPADLAVKDVKKHFGVEE